jgi:hypothetical protein
VKMLLVTLLLFNIADALVSAQSNAEMAAAENDRPSIDITVVRPNIVVRGKHLSRVELWFWPTGTGVTKPVALGPPWKTSSSGTRRIWIFRIPEPPVLAVEVFARGFDVRGKVVATRALPVKGASAIHELLYGIPQR